MRIVSSFRQKSTKTTKFLEGKVPIYSKSEVRQKEGKDWILSLCVVDKSDGSFMRSEYTEARNRWGGVMRSIVLFPDRSVR